ncbi:MAG: cyclic nucleotide-binding domain-containing protein [Rhodospirillales bacterium]|nr:cyclic nucleotide-binding domain-containing protein [Rhodospirillales bacterium]
MNDFPDHLFTRMLFKAGEVIFEEGQRGDCAYLVDDGEVAILKRRARGFHPLARIGPGGIFGEMALVDDQPRMAQAKALADTNCVIIQRDRVRARIDAADPLVRALLRIFVQNIRSLTRDP